VVLASVADAKLCGGVLGPTGRQVRHSIRGATVAKKNSSPGRARISRKAIAQGRPDDPATPVVLPRALFSARGPRVVLATRPSLRPLLFGGTLSDHNLGVMRREIATVRPDFPEAAESCLLTVLLG
jgi:hypothetical protein